MLDSHCARTVLAEFVAWLEGGCLGQRIAEPDGIQPRDRLDGSLRPWVHRRPCHGHALVLSLRNWDPADVEGFELDRPFAGDPVIPQQDLACGDGGQLDMHGCVSNSASASFNSGLVAGLNACITKREWPPVLWRANGGPAALTVGVASRREPSSRRGLDNASALLRAGVVHRPSRT